MNEASYTHPASGLKLLRYPPVSDPTLRPFSAIDDLLMSYSPAKEDQKIALVNDRFGTLACCLHAHKPIFVSNFKSQEKALDRNLALNQLSPDGITRTTPLEILPKIDIGLIKVPKSHQLFELQLAQLSASLHDEGVVYAGFMTKYFTKQLLSIAEKYFQKINQSKAIKKARVLILEQPIKQEFSPATTVISHEGERIQQYPGVFSGNKVDYASLFMLEHLTPPQKPAKVLDLASGNGVLAMGLRKHCPDAEIHCVDDSYLAIASSGLNLTTNSKHHWSDTLEELDADCFDYIISNPPFHFDHETNVEVTYSLFRDAYRTLKSGGIFELVANRHLPYKKELSKLFDTVELTNENAKFRIWRATKD